MFDPHSLDRWSRFLLQTNGPFSFRFILQPTMALFLGIRAGIRDAQQGKAPYFWSVIKHPESRRDLIKNGWKDTARLFVLAVVLDMLVQWLMFRWIYPGGAILVGFLLAVPCYVIIRGPTTRIIGKVHEYQGKHRKTRT